MKVHELTAGDVLVKGRYERLFRGLDRMMVAYQTKTDIRKNRITIVRRNIFEDWMVGAKLKSEVPE